MVHKGLNIIWGGHQRICNFNDFRFVVVYTWKAFFKIIFFFTKSYVLYTITNPNHTWLHYRKFAKIFQKSYFLLGKEKFVPIYRLVNKTYPYFLQLLNWQKKRYFQFSPPPCAHLFMSGKKITYVIVKEGIVDIC